MTNDEIVLSQDDTRCSCGKLRLPDSCLCQECEDQIKGYLDTIDEFFGIPKERN